jgi:type IV pilus assembly protein PilX
MNNKITGSSSCVREKGATLIVSLVILAVITVLGVASMRSSNLELKMAASARDRAVAMQAAEAALQEVEKILAADKDAAGNLNFPVQSFMPNCSQPRCFTPSCPDGLCFSGDFEAARTRDDCSLANVAAPGNPRQVRQHWREEGNWQADQAAAGQPPGFVQVLVNDDTDPAVSQIPVKFLIEFMCFVPKNENTNTDEDHSQDLGVPLYQVTVRASGQAGRATVMLQSVFKGTSTK